CHTAPPDIPSKSRITNTNRTSPVAAGAGRRRGGVPRAARPGRGPGGGDRADPPGAGGGQLAVPDGGALRRAGPDRPTGLQTAAVRVGQGRLPGAARTDRPPLLRHPPLATPSCGPGQGGRWVAGLVREGGG